MIGPTLDDLEALDAGGVASHRVLAVIDQAQSCLRFARKFDPDPQQEAALVAALQALDVYLVGVVGRRSTSLPSDEDRGWRQVLGTADGLDHGEGAHRRGERVSFVWRRDVGARWAEVRIAPHCLANHYSVTGGIRDTEDVVYYNPRITYDALTFPAILALLPRLFRALDALAGV